MPHKWVYLIWCSSQKIIIWPWTERFCHSEIVWFSYWSKIMFNFIKALSQSGLDLSVPSALPSTGEAIVRSYTITYTFSHPKHTILQCISLSLCRICECWRVTYRHEVHHRPCSTNTAVDWTFQGSVCIMLKKCLKSAPIMLPPHRCYLSCSV